MVKKSYLLIEIRVNRRYLPTELNVRRRYLLKEFRVKRKYLPKNSSSLVIILLITHGPDGILDSKAT